LVVAGGVDGELAEEFAGGGVGDADVVVVDEEHDRGLRVDASDADVVEPSVDAQGDGACVVDAVVSDAVVGRYVESGRGRRGLGSVAVDGLWCAPVAGDTAVNARASRRRG
jgi:hypothetical protein